jgi:hypothetical protein
VSVFPLASNGFGGDTLARPPPFVSASSQNSAPGVVFLSYAREDTDAARRIAEAMHAFGMHVWFDQSELRGGEEWDQKIKRQIRECALFVPLISRHTQERAEGYFRREWKLAAERTRDMAAGVPFIVPIVLDDTGEGVASVPEEFSRYQWMRLPHGVPSTEVIDRLSGLLRQPRVPAIAGAPAPAVAAAVLRQSGPRRLALALLAACGLILGAWWATTTLRTTVAPAETPVVVLMDSAFENRVYDETTRKNGGTNADDITEVLRDLPITIVKELTSKAWDREAEILKVNPALVVVHRSCFMSFPPDQVADVFPLTENRFLAFLGYVSTLNPHTKFLVYSRGSFEGEKVADEWRAGVERRFPALAGRVTPWRVPQTRATFRDPLTGRELKEEVERQLGLVAQPRPKK